MDRGRFCRCRERRRSAFADRRPEPASTRVDDPLPTRQGDRLRDWMGIGSEIFYDPDKLAIISDGLFVFRDWITRAEICRPRPECRAAWHDKLFEAMPQIELVLVIGQYAQSYHLGSARKKSLTETVAAWRAYFEAPPAKGKPAVLPLPHPSWRNNAWLRETSMVRKPTCCRF